MSDRLPHVLLSAAVLAAPSAVTWLFHKASTAAMHHLTAKAATALNSPAAVLTATPGRAAAPAEHPDDAAAGGEQLQQDLFWLKLSYSVLPLVWAGGCNLDTLHELKQRHATYSWLWTYASLRDMCVVFCLVSTDVVQYQHCHTTLLLMCLVVAKSQSRLAAGVVTVAPTTAIHAASQHSFIAFPNRILRCCSLPACLPACCPARTCNVWCVDDAPSPPLSCGHRSAGAL